MNWLMPRLLVFLLFVPLFVWSHGESKNHFLQHLAPPETSKNYVAQIQLHTPEELETLFRRVDEYVEKGNKFPSYQPIAVILHGPELQVFDRKNYQKYKHIVSMAARLEAYNVIDVQVCEIQIELEGVNRGDLPVFVDSVPFGPAEVDRLLKKGYEYF